MPIIWISPLHCIHSRHHLNPELRLGGRISAWLMFRAVWSGFTSITLTCLEPRVLLLTPHKKNNPTTKQRKQTKKKTKPNWTFIQCKRIHVGINMLHVNHLCKVPFVPVKSSDLLGHGYMTLGVTCAFWHQDFVTCVLPVWTFILLMDAQSNWSTGSWKAGSAFGGLVESQCSAESGYHWRMVSGGERVIRRKSTTMLWTTHSMLLILY